MTTLKTLKLSTSTKFMHSYITSKAPLLHREPLPMIPLVTYKYFISYYSLQLRISEVLDPLRMIKKIISVFTIFNKHLLKFYFFTHLSIHLSHSHYLYVSSFDKRCIIIQKLSYF